MSDKKPTAKPKLPDLKPETLTPEEVAALKGGIGNRHTGSDSTEESTGVARPR